MNKWVTTTVAVVSYGAAGTLVAAGAITALPAAAVGLGAASTITAAGWGVSTGVGALTSLLAARRAKSSWKAEADLKKKVDEQEAAGLLRDAKIAKVEERAVTLEREEAARQAETENMLRFIRCLVAAAEADGPLNAAERSEIITRSFSTSLHCTDVRVRQEIKAAMGSKITASEAWSERMKITSPGLLDELLPAIIAVIEIDVSGRRNPAEDGFVSAWRTFEGTTRPAPHPGDVA